MERRVPPSVVIPSSLAAADERRRFAAVDARPHLVAPPPDLPGIIGLTAADLAPWILPPLKQVSSDPYSVLKRPGGSPHHHQQPPPVLSGDVLALIESSQERFHPSPPPPPSKKKKGRTDARAGHASSLSSELARQRRRTMADQTRILEGMMPWTGKLSTAAMLEEARRYMEFLKAQVSALQTMPVAAGGFVPSPPRQGVDGAGGVLWGLNRQQILQVVVNSQVVQDLLSKMECCVFSAEQVAALAEMTGSSSSGCGRVVQCRKEY